MKLKIEYKKTDDLIPYVNNSRTHSEEQVAQIAASIKEFGWTNPILLDGDFGVIAGHGRLLAARKLGEKEVPTIELSGLTDIQRKAYIIADNQLALKAGWNGEMLGIEIADLKDFGFDISLMGFDENELELLINNFDADEIDEIEEVNESVNFIVKCENISEKEQIKERLGITSEKINFKSFMEAIDG